MMMTSESEVWTRISAYLAENKRKAALEADKQSLVVEAINKEMNISQQGQTTASESRRLDCIYDDEPLGFEKNPSNELQKMQAQDPLEEIDLGDGVTKRPTYISTKVGSRMKAKLIEVLWSIDYLFSQGKGQ